MSASSRIKALKTLLTTKPLNPTRHLSSISLREPTPEPEPEEQDQSTFTFSQPIHLKNPSKPSPYGGGEGRSSSSVTMPTSFMTGSIVGKRFYKEAKTREADDGNGWTVLLDYRTLKTPSKNPLKCPSLSLAMAIAAEWDYQLDDGIRPFTMPIMKLACTALERVPLTRPKIIENLMKKFHQDLVFCRSPGDCALTVDIREHQVKKIDPLLRWVEKEFGCKPVTYSSFFGGKQDDDLVNAVQDLLKKTDNCELAAIDAIAAATQSLIIGIGIFKGKLQIEEAVELTRLEEDMQIDKWGLVEGGHDIDVADLRVQISSAAVFLGLSRRS